MVNQIKIALTGQMRSGKDTVADYLAIKYGFYRFAFGDALKVMAHEIFPDVPKEPKPRELYQFMNVMREYDEDVWVKHVGEAIEHLEETENAPNIVITDLRQENEYEWCKNNGFIIIRVVTDTMSMISRLEKLGESVDPKHFQHTTETSMDGLKVDYAIPNDGTLYHLYDEIDEIMEHIQRREK